MESPGVSPTDARSRCPEMVELSMVKTISLRQLLAQAAQMLPLFPGRYRRLRRLVLLKPDHSVSPGLLLERQARRFPHRPALLYGEQTLTWGAFNRTTNRYARLLLSMGVRKGDCVALLTGNCPDTLLLVAALAKIGAVAGMMNHRLQAEALTKNLRILRPKLMISTPDLLGLSRQAGTAGLTLMVTEGPAGGDDDLPVLKKLALVQADANPGTTAGIRGTDRLFYIFTSGTTGHAKASVMTNFRWFRSVLALPGMALCLKPRDVIYCPLPLYHNNALGLAWGASLESGAALALAESFSTSGFWDEARRFSATVFCYVGELCSYLMSNPPSPEDRNHQVTRILGNGMRPEIWQEFRERFGIQRIHEFYGASEGNIAFVNYLNLPGTVGTCLLPYAIVRWDLERDDFIRDDAGRVVRAGKGESGLLLGKISERSPFDGYKNQANNQSKIFDNVFEEGDSWFNTGDLMRNLGCGHTAFVDRLGDTFRWKGENVATSEVEEAIAGFADVASVVVYGVRVAGHDGRAGMATITCRGPAPRFAADHFYTWLRQNLPAYAIPRFLRIRQRPAAIEGFKHSRHIYQKEGFDPAFHPGDIYLTCMDEKDGYRPLTTADLERWQPEVPMPGQAMRR